MTDLTPKERGIAISVDAERIYAALRGEEPEGYDGALAEFAADEIRAAVAAEREACEQEALGHFEQACGRSCGVTIAAAIRARGEKE
jgi:hypothetical protein